MATAYLPTSSIAQTMRSQESQKLLNLLIVDDDRLETAGR